MAYGKDCSYIKKVVDQGSLDAKIALVSPSQKI